MLRTSALFAATICAAVSTGAYAQTQTQTPMETRSVVINGVHFTVQALPETRSRSMSREELTEAARNSVPVGPPSASRSATTIAPGQPGR